MTGTMRCVAAVASALALAAGSSARAALPTTGNGPATVWRGALPPATATIAPVSPVRLSAGGKDCDPASTRAANAAGMFYTCPSSAAALADAKAMFRSLHGLNACYAQNWPPPADLGWQVEVLVASASPYIRVFVISPGSGSPGYYINALYSGSEALALLLSATFARNCPLAP